MTKVNVRPGPTDSINSRDSSLALGLSSPPSNTHRGSTSPTLTRRLCTGSAPPFVTTTVRRTPLGIWWPTPGRSLSCRLVLHTFTERACNPTPYPQSATATPRRTSAPPATAPPCPGHAVLRVHPAAPTPTTGAQAARAGRVLSSTHDLAVPLGRTGGPTGLFPPGHRRYVCSTAFVSPSRIARSRFGSGFPRR